MQTREIKFIFVVLMCERKAWTKEEDELLIQIMSELDENQGQKKPKWNDIAARISQSTCKTVRRGKQCRERWFNQLHPSISKEQNWLPEEEKILFQLQEEYGNHWAKIAKRLPGRSDNNIKNYFYSCLRKALRKVNNYVHYNKRVAQYKNLKAFHNSTLSKILRVAENKGENKTLIVKFNAPELAKEIKKMLIDIQVFSKDKEVENHSEIMDQIVPKIQQFNRICKRKKSKKKRNQRKESVHSHHQIQYQESSQEESEQDQISSLNQKMKNDSNSAFSGPLAIDKSGKKQTLHGSQDMKIESQGLSIKYSKATSLDESKKVKKEVLIPSCRYNSPANQNLNHSQSNKISETGLGFSPPSNLSNLARQQEPRDGLCMPFLPLIPSYYHGSGFMPTTFLQEQPNNPPQNSAFTYPFSNSSFSLSSEWRNLQKINPFAQELQKQQQQQQKKD